VKSIFRATAILSTSSFVSILVGLVSAKIWAVLLGPGGVGYLGLVQALVGLTGLVAGLGIGSGVISMVAGALAQENFGRVAALQRAAWLLFWAAGGLAMLVLTVLRVPLSRWMLGGPEHAGDVMLLSLALLFSLASGLQISILNAYHRISALAKIGVVNSVLSTAASLAVVWLWRSAQGITLAVIAGAAVSLAVSTYFLRRETHQAAVRPTRSEIFSAAWALLRFGAPYSASQLVGTGVQFALPALVLHSLSIDSVGYYRAALSMAGVYLGFLLTAMGQDYYPRLSAVADRPHELVRLVNQQHRLVMILAVPMIMGTLALAPFLVQLVYSPQFAPAVTVLEWQLIGDLFKFSSWTMGFVILARRRTLTLFLVELLAGLDILGMSWLGIRWFGLAGLGIGYLGTYIVHYLVTSLIVRKDIGLVWTLDNKLILIVATLAALIVRLLPSFGQEQLRTGIALSFALVAGAAGLYILWREIVRDRMKVAHDVQVGEP
jgi:enterobacterial common antigen flippase